MLGDIQYEITIHMHLYCFVFVFRYFGGDLQVMSMEGYGTDSFIYLPRLALNKYGDDKYRKKLL